MWPRRAPGAAVTAPPPAAAPPQQQAPAAAAQLHSLLALAARAYHALRDGHRLDPAWMRTMEGATTYATVAGYPVSVTASIPGHHRANPTIEFRARMKRSAPLFGLLERLPAGWQYDTARVYAQGRMPPEVLEQAMRAVMAGKGVARRR